MTPAYQYSATVVRWIDGDSVILNIDCGFDMTLKSQNVRLNGIDTSETRGGTLDLKWLGNLAKKFCIEAAPVDSRVTIKTSLDKKGKFGRILADIYLEDNQSSLNDTLKLERLAVDYHGQNKSELIEQHLQCIEYQKEKRSDHGLRRGFF
jgi:endonuclease YncB( thermonuclease family)